MNTLLTDFGGWQPIVDAPAWVVLLLKVTAILLAAWLAHLALARSNPRWRVFLWRVTAVGLVALPVVAWLLPTLKIHVQQRLPAKEAAAVAILSEAPLADRVMAARPPIGVSGNLSDTLLPMSPSMQPEVMGSSTLSRSQPLAPTSPKVSPATWRSLLLATWLCGIAVLAFRLAIGYYRICAWSAAAPTTQWVRSECMRVAEAVGCRSRVEVIQSTEVESPFICGFRQPLLLLPVRMCEASYRKDLPGILAHELTHARLYDIPWNFGLQLIAIVLWFHPLIWRIREAHLAACELVSDAASASFVGDVANYCRTLARVAVDACASLPAAGIAMARTSAVIRRLSALRKKVFHLPLRRRSVLGFGFAALLALAVVGSLQFAPAAPSAAEPAAAATDARGEQSKKKAAENVAGRIVDSKGAAASAPAKSVVAQRMRVLVLDPQGKPLSDAKVHASIWTKEKGFKANHDYTTNAAGIAQAELPKTYYIVRLWASKKPFVTLFANWEANELASGAELPHEYAFRLERRVTAGGRIVDEQARPIVGAKVQVSLEGNLKPYQDDGRARYDTWLAEGSDAATTDADGRWRIDNVPDNANVELNLSISHPDYVSDERRGQTQSDAGITTAMLRQGTATLTLKRGIIMRGRVTDPAGKPIKDALVVRLRNVLINWCGSVLEGAAGEVLTDADGQFRLRAMRPGQTTLAVVAPGWAPQLRNINLKADMPSEDFRLAPGKRIELRFVDAAGKPVPQVEVRLARVGGGMWFFNTEPNAHDTKIPVKADKNGIWRWSWAPDIPVKLGTYREGFADCELETSGGAPSRTVTLKPAYRVTGRVSDALTGKPIPLFAVIPVDVFRKDWLHAERMNAKIGRDGRLDYHATRTDIPLRLRVEAAGYRTQTGPEFHVGVDTPRTRDFRLQPSTPITGVVLDSAGQPVAKAEVLLATPTEQVRFDESSGIPGNHKTITDAGGHFTFPDPGEPFTMLSRADAGFARADFPADLHDAGVLRLQPWASVRGQFRDGGKPVKGAIIFVQPIRLDGLDQPRIDARMYTRTGADGRFEFPRVLPASVSVRVDLGPWEDATFRSGPSVPLELQPGRQAELNLGGAGTIVKGKVTLTGKVPADLDCTYSLNYLVSRTPGIAPPPAIASAGFDARNGWQSTWHKTAEGRAYLSTLRHWFVKLAPDGAFRISGVPSGEYDLAVEVYAKPSGCLVDPLARKVVSVTVTEADVKRGEMTLPEIATAVMPIPAVGDTPAISFQHADSTAGTLTDFRGRFTVVYFWASWCGPCKQQLPTLRQLRDQFAARGLAVLGLSLDDAPAAWHTALKRLNLPCT